MGEQRTADGEKASKEGNRCGFYCNANKGPLGRAKTQGRLKGLKGRKERRAGFLSFCLSFPKRAPREDIPFPARYCPFWPSHSFPLSENRSYLSEGVGLPVALYTFASGTACAELSLRWVKTIATSGDL